MSAGCAIVASDTQPLHEAIRHDETGRLVNFFDVAGLTNQVRAAGRPGGKAAAGPERAGVCPGQLRPAERVLAQAVGGVQQLAAAS